MHISIVGTGYVGLVTAACFAEMGNAVYCVDTDMDKIQRLNNDEAIIYEPQLQQMVQRNREKGNLCFSPDIQKALDEADICFIAVGTPMAQDGSADLSQVMAVAKDIGRCIGHDMIVVNKSTVPVGTANSVAGIIAKEQTERGTDYRVSVLSNPEFLKEGSAVNDCMRPDRIVIGSEDEHATKTLQTLYAPFVRNHDRFILMDPKSAEMTKYAANAMLATRISFMNEMANLCERVGADINNIRRGIGSDSRIGYSFLYAGCGYGGSCFPKDVQALIKTAADVEFPMHILKSVEDVNRAQKMVLVDKIVRRFGEDLNGKRFAVWGLAFKPGTDDMREAPSIVIIQELVKRGAHIQAFDPKAMDTAKGILSDDAVDFSRNPYDALSGADALVLVTEWKEFRSPDFKRMEQLLNNKLIFDGRNQYDASMLSGLGFEYEQIGRGQ